MRLKGYAGLFLVCLFYWILDSVWSIISYEYNLRMLIFREPSSLLDTFLLRVPPYQVVSRLMVVCLFLVFGAIILEFMLRMRTQAKGIEAAHNTLLTVLNSIDATIYVADMETYQILFMNKYMIDHFGGDHSGRTCYEVFRNITDVCEHCTNAQLVDGEGNPKGVVIWEGFNPVSDAWYMNYDRAIRWVDGRIVRLQIATDISRLKELQESQIKAEAQLLQARKMESIGRLAGGVAHDLNNLLSPILGYSELLLDGALEGEEGTGALREIIKAANRARDLVRQLLAFGRKQMMEFKSFDLNKVLREFEKLIRRAIREDIDIHFNLDASLPFVRGDTGQLEQVVMNLAVNAQHAMPEGGALFIETFTAVFDESDGNEDSNGDLKPGRYAGLIVRDTGTGIDDETREKLFEPFYSTKAKDEGTGLGLATVYGIVKQHGGTIRVLSEIGKGSTFEIYLPVSEDLPSAEEAAPKRTEAMDGSETILLVEDDMQVRALARTILRQRGYHVLVAGNGREALGLLEHFEKPIHMLVTDVVMPQMNGKELFQTISPSHPDMKVLYISGYSDDIIAAKDINSGQVDFMQKPFSVVALAAKVRELLDNETAPQAPA